MVGLKVIDDQIVDLPIGPQDVAELLEISIGRQVFDRVDQNGLLIQDQIRVIGDAAGDRPDSLEQRRTTVIDTDPVDILDNGYSVLHRLAPLSHGFHRASCMRHKYRNPRACAISIRPGRRARRACRLGTIVQSLPGVNQNWECDSREERPACIPSGPLVSLRDRRRWPALGSPLPN